ncbi:MAG TPA: acyl-CoA dehydrogenase family protein [Acidimicrobiia bacterium]|nr:acyl-CoA dehydrogenase family protein [Acidimicrobiia bacterium]
MTDALQEAIAATDAVGAMVDQAVHNLAVQVAVDGKVDVDELDKHPVIAYDLAHAAAAVEAAKVMCAYGEHGELESMLACAFVADAIADIMGRLVGRDGTWGVNPADVSSAHAFVSAHRDPAFLEQVADECIKHGTGPNHLDDDFELVADTFRRFAEDKIRPVAEHVHRTNGDVPEELITGLAELGGFGLSVPEEYGGFATGGESDYIGMVVSTEELSRGSLGIGGSLITRPEILTRALVGGGTEEQKQTWLPRIASGELMVGIMVTEPDFGSDSAGVKVTATAVDGGYVVNGVKTWATFAGRADIAMLLAVTDPSARKHRNVSVLIVEKPRAEGHAFAFEDRKGGKMEGRAIDTIGYRGMHSYEVAFDNWFVPAENVIGEAEGLNKGFYYQMAGFENGRLQTAARAVGLMQAAFEAGLSYSQDRTVFDKTVFDYQLSKAKIARMAALIQAGRQFSYAVAKEMAAGRGTLEAAMVKAYVCRAAEWVTREAMQLHGGMGYAEEFPVSRFYVDARVLSIFEGADELLCMRVITRRLCERAIAKS